MAKAAAMFIKLGFMFSFLLATSMAVEPRFARITNRAQVPDPKSLVSVSYRRMLGSTGCSKPPSATPPSVTPPSVTPPSITPPAIEKCKEYKVADGDTCFKIWNKEHMKGEDFYAKNPGVDCYHLIPGQKLCVGN